MDSKLDEKAEEQLDSNLEEKPTLKLDREKLDEVAGGAKAAKNNDGPIELPAI